MSNLNGYIKLHRKLLAWEWYSDINVRVLFFHCLLKANHKKEKWQGIEINAGQFVTSLGHLSKECGLTEQQTRTALNKLKLTSEITSKSTSRYSIITINNWNLYQTNNTQDNKQITNSQQTNNNKQEYKEIKEYKENKNISLLSEKSKKEDPLISKSTKFFILEFSNIFGSKPFLSFNDRVKINELSAQYDDFLELIPTAIQRLKNIEFKDIDFKPSASWLLKGNNFERVMNGEFEKSNNDVSSTIDEWVKGGK